MPEIKYSGAVDGFLGERAQNFGRVYGMLFLDGLLM